MRQLRLAFRTLLRSPFVTIVALLSLSLGIGANTAIFSLFHAMILRPLPVVGADRLVNLSSPGPKPGAISCGGAGSCDEVFSYPMFRDLERDQTVFTGIAAHVGFNANVGVSGSTTNEQGMQVSGSYFPLLGVTPALGRLFSPADDAALGEPRAVVLGYEYWQTRFSGRADAAGSTVVINGQPMTIVGVAPQGFRGTTSTIGTGPAVYVPITLRRVVQPTFNAFENRRSYWAYLFARLEPGVSREAAQTSLNARYRAIINDVEAPLQEGMSPQTLERFRARELGVADGRRGQNRERDAARGPLTALLALTAAVLLIACANVANLLLARAAGRATEIAVRLAIGAGRRHLIGQLLLESCLLSVLGGILGVLLAFGLVAVLGTMMPNPGGGGPTLDLNPTVLGFTALLSLGTGIVFGLFPALNSTRPNVITALRQQAGQPSGGRAATWFRATLATSQMAMSMTLLVVAGLLTRSLFNISRVDLGMRTDHLLTFTIAPRLNGYDPARTRAFFERAEDAVAAVPGVTGVTSASVRLLAGNNWGNGMSIQGFEAGPDTDTDVSMNRIGPDFFRTIGGRVLSGREFRRADTVGSPKVAIVNETFAKRFNLGRDAVGKRIGMERKGPLDIEIVGLVADMKYSEVKDTIPAQAYLPYRQDEQLGNATFYVQSSLDPGSLQNVVRDVMRGLDANLPLVEMRPMTDQVRQNVLADQIVSRLSLSFAMLATLLAAVGLYGVLAYTVSQRTREFGLRMALGSEPAGVRRLVMRQVGWMAGIGGSVGLALAFGAGRVLSGLLFQTPGYDPWAFGGAIAVLSIIAIAAGLVPAIRASRIDPMRALRYE